MKTIYVCVGSACHLKGSYNIIDGLQKLINDNRLTDRVLIKAAFCLGECTKGVCVRIDDGPVLSVNQENLTEFFNEHVIGK
ncbi:NADH:ubiquinone oxidoreductase subunit E [Caldicoprobacter guelmensis]|uniref:(2Fe-2S) ferredoxin domain-containing protein n=1 Tax=Caldicoprobacter guelmensis TaxID=1170224 RepID=UPI00195E28E7|nr:(2Fe-2S) ferredoxin domain-containing protein [Caldicoprobacter guelmensis]MBM7582809.1 NADH:ubiquinone oxidoreductase subunit E [Caldicoprobacter guelmensis]